MAGHCPHCQGKLEMRPGTDQIDLGYRRTGAGFITLEPLDCPRLRVMRDGEAMILEWSDRTLRFTVDTDD